MIIHYKILYMQHTNSHKGKIVLEILANIVKEEREKTKKSQRLLADEYGVQKSLVNRIENCNNEPKFLSVFTICEIIGLKPSELMKKIEEKLPEDFSILEE